MHGTTHDQEKAVQELARSLYHQAAEHKPSIFESQDWLGKMIEWSLNDESLRVALFRFVDVLPSLDSATEIGRHLRSGLSAEHPCHRLTSELHLGRSVWLPAASNISLRQLLGGHLPG